MNRLLLEMGHSWWLVQKYRVKIDKDSADNMKCAVTFYIQAKIEISNVRLMI